MRAGSLGVRAGLALGAALYAIGAACGGGGGGVVVAASRPFSAQLLPLQIEGTSGGAGDVAFTAGADALVVGGGTDTIWRVSRDDGSVTEAATDVVLGAGGNLLSIVDSGSGVVYAGDEAGDIYRVDLEADPVPDVTVLASPAGAGAIDGMVIAPAGYGDFGGSLIAATETGGIVAVDPTVGSSTTIDDTNVYTDVAFLGTTLYATDDTNDAVDTVDSNGTVDPFATGFTTPVGLAADAVNGQLLVADAGSDPPGLWSAALPGEGDPVPVAAVEIGAYPFGSPAGLAFDGVRNLLLVTPNLPDDALVLRGVGIPGLDAMPGIPVLLGGTDVGFGDLALDRGGDLLGTANGSGTNVVFRVQRSDGAPSSLARDLGDAAGGEALTGVAYDAATSTLYVGTDAGNVFTVSSGGAVSLLATLPTGHENEEIVDLALAPETFDPGGLGGQLFVVTGQPDALMGATVERKGGGIYTIDLAIADPVAVNLTTTGYDLADHDLGGLAFSADGTLYVLDEDANMVMDPDQGEVVTVAPNGTVTALPTDGSLVAPDGIAVDEGGHRLFVADPGTDDDPVSMLRAVSLADGAVTDLAPFAFHQGYFPSGLAFDGLGSVLGLNGDLSARIGRATVFPEEP